VGVAIGVGVGVGLGLTGPKTLNWDSQLNCFSTHALQNAWPLLATGRKRSGTQLRGHGKMQMGPGRPSERRAQKRHLVRVLPGSVVQMALGPFMEQKSTEQVSSVPRKRMQTPEFGLSAAGKPKFRIRQMRSNGQGGGGTGPVTVVEQGCACEGAKRARRRRAAARRISELKRRVGCLMRV